MLSCAIKYKKLILFNNNMASQYNKYTTNGNHVISLQCTMPECELFLQQWAHHAYLKNNVRDPTHRTEELTRKDNSRFSPPQISIPGSYVPRYSKYVLSMENRPPAIVGVLYRKESGRTKTFHFVISDFRF